MVTWARGQDRARAVRLIEFAKTAARGEYELDYKLERMMAGDADAGAGQGEPPPYTKLEQFRFAAKLLCRMPDDALDVAKDYIAEKSESLGTKLKIEGHSALLSAQQREMKSGLSALQVVVRAMETPHFDEAHRLAEQLSGELDRLTRRVEQATDAAGATVRRSRRRLRAAVWLVSVVRLSVLALASLTAWWIGYGFGGLPIVLQILIALASFALLELLVGERLIEPRLRAHRRSVMLKCADAIHDDYRQAAVELGALKQVLGRDA